MGKERVTVEIDSELMNRLRAAGVEPVAHIERLVAEDVEQRRAGWAEANAAAIDAYNDRLDKRGLWNDGERRF